MKTDNIIDLAPHQAVATPVPPPVEPPSRIITADANGNITSEPKKEYIITPFPDGAVFKFAPNKDNGNFVLFDVHNVAVAVAAEAAVANLLCVGAATLMKLIQAQQAEAAAAASNPVAGAAVEGLQETRTNDAVEHNG